jgi:hypothetical protein
MQTNGDKGVQDKSAAGSAQRGQLDTSSSRIIKCPMEVRINGALHDQFYDVRDAIASARIAKRNNPTSLVVVTDVKTGKLIIEFEP